MSLIPSAHPGESRDPVLSSVALAYPDSGRQHSSSIHHAKHWVPAFAGMSGI
jgi:hypothetical protein